MNAQAFGTGLAGIGLMFVAASTWLQYQQSRKGQRLTEYQINAEIVRQAMDLMPDLARVLNLPNDALAPDERPIFVKFYLAYAQAWQASRFALQRDEDWNGMRSEFAYWAEQPAAVRALAELRRTPEGWPLGFFEFVTTEIETFRRNRASRESLGASPRSPGSPKRPPVRAHS